MEKGRLVAQLLAVLAATCLVVAFALASLLPPDTQLDQLIAATDPTAVGAFHKFCVAHLPSWAWDAVAFPVLERPCWLTPAALGLVLVGAALTAGSRPKKTARTRRWRS